MCSSTLDGSNLKTALSTRKVCRDFVCTLSYFIDCGPAGVRRDAGMLFNITVSKKRLIYSTML